VRIISLKRDFRGWRPDGNNYKIDIPRGKDRAESARLARRYAGGKEIKGMKFE